MNEGTSGEDLNPAQVIRALMILAIAMIAGCFIFLVIVLVLVQTNGPLMPELEQWHRPILIGLLVFTFISLLLAKRIMLRGTVNAKESVNSDSFKLNIYRNSFVVYLVVMEIPVWISLCLYLFTGSFPFLAMPAVILGLMITTLPRRKRVYEQLAIDER